MSSSLQLKAERLRELHHGPAPLVLPNAWDAASARLVEAAGFPVVATSSGALNASLGWGDASLAPPDEVFAAVSRVARAVQVPVTADLEDGYGLSPEEFVARLLSAGAVGCNLEDTDYRSGGAALVPAEAQAERLAAVVEAGRSSGVDVVVNARVDVHLRGWGQPEERLDEALRRARLYAGAGAVCVYPITVHDEPTVRGLVAGAGAPVNFLARPLAADVERLTRLGAARISFGSGLARLATTRLEEALAALAPPPT
ncbi:MAG TPA: isocitrate lyase/phosphoenolpyruvate mutase family protein [Acidimicrobiales bacterium]|nr:isocitrate lyase/phosphoenolpyruvate mutase family protein [Acidimicrobiales bacterium]